MNKYTCAYIRLSIEDLGKDRNTQSESIKNQINYIREFAKSNNLEIYKNYIDDGFSGGNFERPAFKEMIRDIEDNKIECIITKDISRLGREFIDTAYYISEYFLEKNIRYIAINDNYDSLKKDDSFKDILVEVKSLINDRYIRDSSKKIKEIKRLKTQQKNYLGFIAPYGYKKVKKENRITLEIDEFASKIVNRIFYEKSRGDSPKEIAKRLNDDNIDCPMKYLKMTKNKNKNYYMEWTSAIIYRIIRNRIYVGDTTIRKSTKFNYKQLKRDYILYNDRKYMKNTHTPIIDIDIFNKANEKVKSVNSISSIKNPNKYNGNLKDKVICGECGNIMHCTARIRESGNLHYKFKCYKSTNRKTCMNRSISLEIINKIIYNVLIELINNIKEDDVLNSYNNRINNKEKIAIKIKQLKVSIEENMQNIKNLYFKKVEGLINTGEFITQKEKEINSKLQKEEEIKKLESVCIEEEKREILRKEYKELLTKENINEYGIKELIDKVIVNKDNTLIIKFKFNIEENVILNI